MKKIIALMLTLVMVIGLVACGNKDENPTEPEVTNPTETVAPTDEVTEPVEDTQPVEDTEPVGDVVEVDEKIMAVFAEVQEKMGETYRANMEIPAEMLADMFGLDASTYESAYGMMPMISAHVDTLVGVKATDTEAVKAALETYVEGKKNDRMQYPINAAAMGAMKVVVVNDYVWLLGIFGDTDSVAESGDEVILQFACDTVAMTETVVNTHCGK